MPWCPNLQPTELVTEARARSSSSLPTKRPKACDATQFRAAGGCRRQDSNLRHADYDSAPLFSGAFGCSAFWPLIGRFRAIGPLSAFGCLWMLPCPPLAHLETDPASAFRGLEAHRGAAGPRLLV